MDDLLDFDVQILNYNDELEFNDAVKSRLNNGYTLGASNAYFDNKGQQHFYALFYWQIKKPIKFTN